MAMMCRNMLNLFPGVEHILCRVHAGCKFILRQHFDIQMQVHKYFYMWIMLLTSWHSIIPLTKYGQNVIHSFLVNAAWLCLIPYLTSSCRSTCAPEQSSKDTTSLCPLELADIRAVQPSWGTQWGQQMLMNMKQGAKIVKYSVVGKTLGLMIAAFVWIWINESHQRLQLWMEFVLIVYFMNYK